MERSNPLPTTWALFFTNKQLTRLALGVATRHGQGLVSRLARAQPASALALPKGLLQLLTWHMAHGTPPPGTPGDLQRQKI
jgi:hypothetical protein